MPNRSPSKQRLEELIALARTYRGWSNKDLARELGRDVHHLVPDSGVPKLDIVIALAGALDWTVQDVVDDLCGNVPTTSHEKPKETWAELDRAAWSALQAGEYSKAASIARREYLAATNATERAYACMRECGVWDCVGRYLAAMECCHRGLRERDADIEVTLTLRNNLANLHSLLGHLDEAHGIASATVDFVSSRKLDTEATRAIVGYARHVRGLVVRSRMVGGHHWDEVDAANAGNDLQLAAAMLTRAGESLDSPLHRAIASVADAASISIECFSGRLTIDDAVERHLRVLDDHVELGRGDRLLQEAIGWWSVFGAELAVSRLKDEGRLGQLLGIFTNKVDEVASVTGNWALRERLWFIELTRREFSQSEEDEWVIDSQDARELSGAMARFPRFREIGWRVFRQAKIGDGG